MQKEVKLLSAMEGGVPGGSDEHRRGEDSGGKVEEIMSSCQNQNLLQLGFMILSNVLRADFKFQENILLPELVQTLQVVLGRRARGERTRIGLQQVATKLGVLIETAKGTGGEAEQKIWYHKILFVEELAKYFRVRDEFQQNHV